MRSESDMTNDVFIGIDVGGSWLKGTVFSGYDSEDHSRIAESLMRSPVHRVPSRLGVSSDPSDFIRALDELLSKLVVDGDIIAGIGISTAGVVDYAGRNLLLAAPHLEALRTMEWREYLEQKYKAPVVLINDADAALLGAAARGYLSGLHTIGVMPVGTGVGFSLWRNGRRWAPGKTLPLIDSIATPAGTYDSLGGVSRIAGTLGNDLCAFFIEPQFESQRETYLDQLADIVYSVCIIYRADTVLIGGGLADAVTACDYPLGRILMQRTGERLSGLGLSAVVKVLSEGNRLPLIGAVLLALGEHVARRDCGRKEYARIGTEMPLKPTVMLQKMSGAELVNLLWRAEQQAGETLGASLGAIARVAEIIAERLSSDGRLIYVGAGTSGRLAAIDAVELACTFGLPREKVYALIAGGVSDASIEIEDNFEEDASCVPEMLLTSVGPSDVVVGISVSGSAYYVRSALAIAREFGAYAVFVQENVEDNLSFADVNIALHSGREIIAGSTRMKAGTATKKVLNFLSTIAMVRMGKVYGPYMVGMECINAKLICRAQAILGRLFGLDAEDASSLLAAHGYDLKRTVVEVAARKNLIYEN